MQGQVRHSEDDGAREAAGHGGQPEVGVPWGGTACLRLLV